VEDGSVHGGVGTRLSQLLSESGVSTPVRHIGVPREFPTHGAVADVRAWAGLKVQDIGRRIVEWSVLVAPDEPAHDVPAAERAMGESHPAASEWRTPRRDT
jgi:1-deoxy-D-xylulose-5-phosphate synthase